MDLDKLTLSDKLIGGAGLVLAIDLLVLPWHNIDLGFISETRTAIQSPNSLWGLLALLIALATAGSLLADRLTEVELPELPISWDQAWTYGSFACAGLVVFKLIIETEFLGFGSYLAVLAGGAMAYGGFLLMQSDEGGSSAPPAPPTEF